MDTPCSRKILPGEINTQDLAKVLTEKSHATVWYCKVCDKINVNLKKENNYGECYSGKHCSPFVCVSCTNCAQKDSEGPMYCNLCLEKK